MDWGSIAMAVGSSIGTAALAFVAFRASTSVRLAHLEGRSGEDRVAMAAALTAMNATVSQNSSQLRTEFTTQLSTTRQEISNTIAHAMNERSDRTSELKADVTAFQSRMDDRFNDLHDLITKALDQGSVTRAEVAEIKGELRGRRGGSSSSTPAQRG